MKMGNTFEIQSIIDALDMQPHPEGGYFKETYRSTGRITGANLPEGIDSPRNYSTAIYFLITSEAYSAFHRIKQDEFWFFHRGSSVDFHTITNKGEHHLTKIGNDVLNQEKPQHMVKGGDWFAAEVKGENNYALVSCTVSPGFDFEDFELANRNQLISLYPNHADIINLLTRQ